MSDEPRVARQMRWLFQAAARGWTWGEIAAAERQSPSGLHFSPETVRKAVRTLAAELGIRLEGSPGRSRPHRPA